MSNRISVRTTLELVHFVINRLNRGMTFEDTITSLQNMFKNEDIRHGLEKYKNESPLIIGKKGAFGKVLRVGDFDHHVEKSVYFIIFVELLRQIKEKDPFHIIDILSTFSIDIMIYFTSEFANESNLLGEDGTPHSYANKFVF